MCIAHIIFDETTPCAYNVIIVYTSDYDLFCGQHECVLLAIMYVYVTLCIIVWHAIVVRHVGKPSGPFPSCRACFEAFRPALNPSDGLPSFKLVPNIYTSEYDLFCGQHECALLAIMYVTGCIIVWHALVVSMSSLPTKCSVCIYSCRSI